MSMTFSDYKKKISIIDLLIHLGYKFDKSKGKSRPNFVLRNEKGEDIDRVIITNPKDTSSQGYWRRDGSKGDLISFVRENLGSFEVKGRNEIDRINKVLAKYSNEEHHFDLDKYLEENEIRQSEPFNPQRYIAFPIKGQEHVADFLFTKRGISRETVKAFSSHIYLVLDQEAKHPFKNIGFPYTLPGSQEICGYEFRGQFGFKGKAAGTDSQNGLWIANEQGKAPQDIKYMFFAESALDILALYQLQKDRIDFGSSILASIGGSFSEHQISGMLAHYPNALAIDCFDNDPSGVLYGQRLAKLAGSRAKSFKAPRQFKDWNDALMGKTQ